MKNKLLLTITVICVLLFSTSAYAQTQGIPVLMYHSIGEAKGNPAVLSTAKFKQQMQYLSEQGYTTLSIDELYTYLSTKNYKLPKKPILITFDDGYRDTYTTALPILKKYGFKSSLFLVADKISKGTFTSAELKAMQQNKMSIYSHTLTHPSLIKLSAAKQETELLTAAKKITGLTGDKNSYFAYPYGHYNKSTLALLKKHGYKLAFGTAPGWVKKGDNPYTLKRIFIGNNLSFTTFKERITRPNYKLY